MSAVGLVWTPDPLYITYATPHKCMRMRGEKGLVNWTYPCWNVRKIQSMPKYLWCALNRMLTTVDDLETAIEGAATYIGIVYVTQKNPEKGSVFICDRERFFPCQQGIASPFVSLCYRWFSTIYEEMLARLLFHC